MEPARNCSGKENLSIMWENFSLSESEGSKYPVYEKGYEGKFLLATRFFTNRVLSMEAMARTIKTLWHTKKRFEACDMGDHRVLFVFSDESDIDKILSGEPCWFDKNLVALRRSDSTRR